jgi:hypothetical protein
MDLDPEARRILSLARAARTPSAADKARVERRLAVSAGVVAGSITTLAAGQAAANGTLTKVAAFGALKWWIGGSAMLVAVASVAAVQLTPAPHEAAPAKPRHAAAVAHEAPVVAAPVEAAEPVQALPAPPVAGFDEAPVTVGEALPPPQRVHEHRRHHGAAVALPTGEVELLHQAQVAWRSGQAKSALELVREHERRFPGSSLSIERDTLTVLSLCELGRKEQAARLARELLTRAPNSPLRSSVEESCALR